MVSDRTMEWRDSSGQLVQSVTWLDIKTSLFKSDKWRPPGKDAGDGKRRRRRRRKTTAFLSKMTTKSAERKGIRYIQN